jgi:hypothetical protein
MGLICRSVARKRQRQQFGVGGGLLLNAQIPGLQCLGMSNASFGGLRLNEKPRNNAPTPQNRTDFQPL